MKSLFLYLFLGLIPLSMMAQWYSFNNNQKNKTAPTVQILSDNNNYTVIKFDISGFNLKELYADNKLYQSLDLLSDNVYTSLAGSPELPYIAKILAIPDKSGVSVEVMNTGDFQTFNNINLPPSRMSWFEGQPEAPYVEDKSAYSSADIYPENLVSLGTPIVFRDFRIVRLAVYPIRYIASKKELQVTSSITVKITYNSENVVNPKTTPTKSIAPSFAKIYESCIFNYKNALSKFKYDTLVGRDVMLCIMPDAYVNDFQAFADWKRKSGVDIVITKFSDIGATTTNYALIRDYIANVYHNSEYPPSYVLLVGDDGVFPIKVVTYSSYSFPNEDYFVEIDGNDFFPEMMVGRFPAASSNELKILINKVLTYEKTPNTTNTDWFKKGICCSNNAYQSQIDTKRITAGMMLEGGFISVDTVMSTNPCTMTVNDVKQAINNGRSFLNYRGEGWYTQWWATCYPFSVSDVSGLNNGTKLTFFTSIGCGVAHFNNEGGNCFGEALIKLGTPTNLRGAIAFIGAASNSHTQYNNQLDIGLYIGMFHEGMETPGQALLRGKLRVFNCFGATDPWVEYHYRLFCILGDPSVHIWKKIPLPVNVNYTSFVPFAYSENLITVKYASTSLPVDSAQVTISGDSVFASGFTDSTGKVTLAITPVSLDSLNITVRGGDVIPYQGKIQVSPVSVPELSGDKKGFGLGKIFPNPFDQSTLINYSILEQSNISLKIYDLNGHLIKVLFEGKQAAGIYSVKWNGQDDAGNLVNDGMYIIKLNNNGLKQTLKLYKQTVLKKQ